MTAVPRHLMKDTLTINVSTWETADGVPVRDTDTVTSYTVMAFVQTTSAADALVAGRDTTTQTFDVFADSLTTSGAAWDLSPAAEISWQSVNYQIVGKPADARAPDGSLAYRKFVIERYTQ